LASASSSPIVASHPAKEFLENGLQIFGVHGLLTSSSAASEPLVSKLVEDILVFETCVRVVLCGASLVIHVPFALIREDLICTKCGRGYLLTSANLSLAVGLEFLSGWYSWASL